MSVTSNRVITGVDKLISIVNDREEISLTNAAKHLNVPKNTVEEWCYSLEEKGLLATRPAIKEKYIMSIDFYNYKLNFVKSLMQNIRSLGSSNKLPEESILKQKEQEINKRLSLLNEKMKDFKKYEKMKASAYEGIAKLNKMQKDFDIVNRQVEKERKQIEKEKEILAKKQSAFLEEKVVWSVEIKDYAMKKKALEERDKKLYSVMIQFEKEISKLKECGVLSNKEHGSLNQLKESSADVKDFKNVKNKVNPIVVPLFKDIKFNAMFFSLVLLVTLAIILY